MYSSLACGDVEGSINAVFNRVRTIQKKSGQFDVSPHHTNTLAHPISMSSPILSAAAAVCRKLLRFVSRSSG